MVESRTAFVDIVCADPEDEQSCKVATATKSLDNLRMLDRALTAQGSKSGSTAAGLGAETALGALRHSWPELVVTEQRPLPARAAISASLLVRFQGFLARSAAFTLSRGSGVVDSFWPRAAVPSLKSLSMASQRDSARRRPRGAELPVQSFDLLDKKRSPLMRPTATSIGSDIQPRSIVGQNGDLQLRWLR